MIFDRWFKTAVKEPNYTPAEVGQFYDQYYDAFNKVYGEVIQAFRTNDLSKILDYQIEQIGLKENMQVLDAGCGVCGPARYFARQTKANIKAITISAEQCKVASEKIIAENLEALINVQQADYHQVNQLFDKDYFDKIYFLESFGHSPNKALLLKNMWKILKPGGEIYIKDLFIRKVADQHIQSKINKEINKINEAYRYEVADLNEFCNLVRDLGFVIVFIKTIDIGLNDFENLAISNEFQELTGIAKIDSWNNYVFPVDFFEVKLYKPEYDTAKGVHRYFIQNLFQIKVNQIDKEDL